MTKLISARLFAPFILTLLLMAPVAFAADATVPVTGVEMEGDKRESRIGATGELVEAGEGEPVKLLGEELPVMIEVTLPPAQSVPAVEALPVPAVPSTPPAPPAPVAPIAAPSPEAPLSPEEPSEPVAAEALPNVEIPRISREDLLRRIREGQDVIIIDARTRKAFAHSLYKIPNAYRIPLSHIKRLAPLLPPGRDIIVYCDTTNETIATHAAAVLINDGYKNTFVLSGGFNGWVFHEYPLEIK